MKAYISTEELLMKAVDGLLNREEQQELAGRIEERPELALELKDFQTIKISTDAMTQRILEDAQLENHEKYLDSSPWTRGSFWAIAGGTLLLSLFALSQLLTASLPWIVQLGLILVVGGLSIVFTKILFHRLRTSSRDPYKDIDQ